MKRACIGVAISSWWGKNTYEDHAFREILTKIMSSPDCPYRDLKWCIYYEKEGYDDPSVDEICSDLQYVIDNYGSLPYYFKLDDKIVVFVWSGHNDEAEYAQRWGEVRNRLGNIYTVLKVFGGYDNYANYADSWHQYAPALRYEEQFKYSAFASPGFWLIHEEASLARDLDEFDRAIHKLRYSGCKFLLIETWNEWHEGTQVEPGQLINHDDENPPFTPASDSYGLDYIDVIAHHMQFLVPNPVTIELCTPLNNTVIDRSEVTIEIRVKDPYSSILDAYISVDGLDFQPMTYTDKDDQDYTHFEYARNYTDGGHSIIVYTKDEFNYFSDNVRLNFTVRLPFNFNIDVKPVVSEIKQGETASFTVDIGLASGTTVIVELSLTGLPRDLIYMFEPNFGNPPYKSILTIETTKEVPIGNYNFTIIGSGGGITRTNPVELSIEERFNFSLDISPHIKEVIKGESVNFSISTIVVSGTAQNVNLSVSGVPNGTICTLDPNQGTPPFISTMTVNTEKDTAAGTYMLNIIGSAGDEKYSETVELTIKERFEFQVNATPFEATVIQGDTAEFDINIDLVSGEAEKVMLTISNLPEHTTYTLSKNMGTPPFNSKLTIYTTSKTPVHKYTIPLLASDGGLNYTASMTLNVESSKKCIIVTVTYGSELSPEVQFLRGFRDRIVMKTFAGKSFMTIFNSWYYLFSPKVASAIEVNGFLRGFMKTLLHPLIRILHFTTTINSMFGFNSELAVVVSGLLASSLIGAIYFTPVVLILCFILKVKIPVKGLRIQALFWFISVGCVTIAEIIQSSSVMMFSTAILVLSTISLTTLYLVKNVKRLTYAK